MEFEDVSERIEWEARRAAAAFELREWKQRNLNKPFVSRFDATSDHVRVNWWIGHAPLSPVRILAIEVRTQRGDDTWLGSNELTFQYEMREVGASTRNLMARGLYRLGIEDKNVLIQLPQLSAHEKMELRLSMPRELWPKQWLEEEER